MLTDDGYRQLMKHAKRLAQEGHGELAQHLRDAIDLRAEVQRLRIALEQIELEANQPYIQRIAAEAQGLTNPK